MSIAALPGISAANNLPVNYIDGVVGVWLVVGFIVGRKRGMTQEVIPTIGWLCAVILAGLFYVPLSAIIFQNTAGAFNHLWANITAYLAIAFAIYILFLWIKQNFSERLTGSDSFGSAEYYLGAFSGFLRFACIVVMVVAFVHSRVYTASELAATDKAQSKDFEGIRFPTYGSVQHAILAESLTGKLLQTYLHRLLITTGPPVARAQTETIAKKREDSINMILGTPPPAKK